MTTNNDARVGTNMIPKLPKNKPRPIIAKIAPIFLRRILNTIFSIFFLGRIFRFEEFSPKFNVDLEPKDPQDKSDFQHEGTISRGIKVSKLAVYDKRNRESQPQC